jgi:hypothetical protein
MEAEKGPGRGGMGFKLTDRFKIAYKGEGNANRADNKHPCWTQQTTSSVQKHTFEPPS